MHYLISDTMKKANMKKIKEPIKKKDMVLEVAEAFPSDVGSNRARIDYQTRIDLDVSIGDTILIKGMGAKTTCAIVWRGHPTDEGKKIIRIDRLTRDNSGTEKGGQAKIRKATAEEKKKQSELRVKKVIYVKEEDKQGIKQRLEAMDTVRTNIDCLIETMGRLENDFKSIHKRFWNDLLKEYGLDETRNYNFNKLTYKITECDGE